MQRYKDIDFWFEIVDELGIFAIKCLLIALAYSFFFSLFINIFIEVAPRMCAILI